MKFCLPLLFLFVLSSSQCQSDYGLLEYRASLPELLQENSGMEQIDNSKFTYVINDSGGSNSVFAIDPTNGSIQQEISVQNAINKDWEDLASSGNDLFIGDFGNNGNLRKDLKIYWLSNIDSLKGDYAIAFAKAISFRLEDQEKFPPKKKDRNFDIESFFAKDNALYLFTRNRSSHFDGMTKCYKLPIEEGHHIAQLIGTFQSCKDEKDCQITSAAYHKETDKIALLSYNKVWLIDQFEEDAFFQGRIRKIKLEHTSQKEAVYFENANRLLISDEGSKTEQPKLYSLKI